MGRSEGFSWRQANYMENVKNIWKHAPLHASETLMAACHAWITCRSVFKVVIAMTDHITQGRISHV